MKPYYSMKADDVLKEMKTSIYGLTQDEAEKILLEKGENVLKEEKKKSVFQVFLSQFADLLVVILIAAAVISMVSGNAESTIVIFCVILMNAILGTVQ